jgi:hypothetical protein
MNDWSEYHVELQPLARKAYEHFNRREYIEALETLNALDNLILNLKMRAVIFHKKELSNANPC